MAVRALVSTSVAGSCDSVVSGPHLRSPRNGNDLGMGEAECAGKYRDLIPSTIGIEMAESSR